MAHLDRFAAGLALSLATAAITVSAITVSGCAASDSGKQSTATVSPPTLGAGAPITGASTPTAGAAAPIPGVGAPVVGAAVTPTVGVPAAGGAAGSPSMSGVLGAAGSSAGTPTGAAGGGMMASATNTWTPQSNLDTSGNLIAPAQGEGFQIQTTTFDLAPGEEVFNCFHAEVPNDAVFGVGEWDGQMTAGSHHFILYRDDGDTTASGTLTEPGCTSGFGGTTWLYTQGTPRSHLLFPDAVAMELSTHERIIFDMHYINTGTETIHAHITLNINKVKVAQYQKADSQVSFNFGISIPPNGMQTVGGDCPPVPGANYFIMQTHTHRRGILATINRNLANGQLGEEFVRTTDWDHPQAHEWQAAPFLTFQSGESFHYSCTYQNDLDQTVTVGTSAATNEMCMAEAYFFPAVANVPACN